MVEETKKPKSKTEEKKKPKPQFAKVFFGFILVILPVLVIMTILQFELPEKPSVEETSKTPAAVTTTLSAVAALAKRSPCNKPVRVVVLKGVFTEKITVRNGCDWAFVKNEEAGIANMEALITIRPNGDKNLERLHGKMPDGTMVLTQFRRDNVKVSSLAFKSESLSVVYLTVLFPYK